MGYTVTFVDCWGVVADTNQTWMKVVATKTVKKTRFQSGVLHYRWQLGPIYKVRKQSRKSDLITVSNRRNKGTDAFFAEVVTVFQKKTVFNIALLLVS